MFIQTEETPNPDVIKFVPGSPVLQGRTADFKTVEEAEPSPMAVELLKIKGIDGVFLGDDFIAVTKSGDKDWFVLKPLVLSTILDGLTMGIAMWDEDLAAQADNTSSKSSNTIHADDDDIVKQIKELIDTRVRPAVAQDGGDIVFNSFEDGIVYLEMRGACAGCPSSTATLKAGIENMLTYYVPEVQEVRPV